MKKAYIRIIYIVLYQANKNIFDAHFKSYCTDLL